MIRIPRIVPAMLVALASLVVAGASQAQGTATLTGRVTDSTAAPIPAATLRIPQLSRAATAGTDGSYRFEALPAGTWWVIAEAPGHRAARVQVTVAAGGTATQGFTLQQAVQLLERVRVTGKAPPKVTPKMVEFEQRRQARRAGAFLGLEELQRFPGQPIEQALRPIVTGSQFIKTPTGQTLLASTRVQRTQLLSSEDNGQVKDYTCHVQVIIDGLVVSAFDQGREAQTYKPPGMHSTLQDPRTQVQGTDGPLDLSTLNVDQFAGVEYYPDAPSTPIQYRGNGAKCGTLILWTRDQ